MSWNWLGPAVLVVADAILLTLLLRRSPPPGGCTYPDCRCARLCPGHDQKGPR